MNPERDLVIHATSDHVKNTVLLYEIWTLAFLSFIPVNPKMWPMCKFKKAPHHQKVPYFHRALTFIHFTHIKFIYCIIYIVIYTRDCYFIALTLCNMKNIYIQITYNVNLRFVVWQCWVDSTVFKFAANCNVIN